MENANINANSSKNEVWPKIENAVSIIGQWSWILVLISVLLVLPLLIFALGVVLSSLVFGLFSEPVLELIWLIFKLVVLLIILIAYVMRVFSKKCAAKDWNFLVNDVFDIGNIRIPKMIVWGIIIVLLTDVWGSLAVIVPALLIIFLGPEKVEWVKNKSNPNK